MPGGTVEVEGVLFQHPDVAGCAVAPVSDEFRGEEVAACVVVREGCQADEKLAHKLFDFCAARLVYFKTPGYVLFVEALPMTASQKVQRGEVRKLVQSLVDQGHCTDLRQLKRRPA